ncbi:MAG: trigger factor [Anaerolineae bacterium]|nr:trigger factor [Anaerolineae bacterium]
MKIKSELQDDHQIKLTVEMGADVLEGAKRKAARQIAKRIKIPGFRPGKAPYNVVQKQVGDGAILEDAVDIVLKDEYPKVIEEAKIDPYGPGALQNIASMEPPIFEFLVPLSPKAELGDYRKIRVPYKAKKVTKKDIDKVVENYRDQQAIIEPADRAAKEGDMVYLVLNAERTDPAEGEEKTLVEKRRFPAVVEKAETKEEDEWPYPGFSRNLIDMASGDTKTVAYTFPKDYEIQSMQGTKAEFQIEVEEVKSRSLPKLDDEFAKTVSEHETYDELIADIRGKLEKQFEAEVNSEYENTVLDKIVKGAKYQYPPQMVEHEMEHYLEDLSRRLASQGLDMDVYLKSRDMDMDALKEEARPNIDERIQRSLTLLEIASQEKIELTQEDVQEQTIKTINEIRQYFPEEEAKKMLAKDSLEALINRIINDEITTRTLARMRMIAKGEEVPAPGEESTEEKPTKKTAAKKAAAPKAKTPAAKKDAAPKAKKTEPKKTAAKKEAAADPGKEEDKA